MIFFLNLKYASQKGSGVEVELFKNGKWERQSKFPEPSRFYQFSTATIHEKLFVIGKSNSKKPFYFCVESPTVTLIQISILKSILIERVYFISL